MILRCLFTESSIILPTTGYDAAPGESESRDLIAELLEQPEVSGVLNTLSSS
jgi:hypothetical protein